MTKATVTPNTTAMTKDAVAQIRASNQRRLRERLAAEVRWLRSALETIERSAERDYLFADSEARNAAQHLVQIGADAAALRVLNEEAAREEKRA
jgi:hypothetical protein